VRPVLLADGPDPWAGVVAFLADEGAGGELERTLPQADGCYVLGRWVPTGDTREVTVERETRGGTVERRHTAQVYRFAGERRVPLEVTTRPERQLELI